LIPGKLHVMLLLAFGAGWVGRCCPAIPDRRYSPRVRPPGADGQDLV